MSSRVLKPVALIPSIQIPHAGKDMGPTALRLPLSQTWLIVRSFDPTTASTATTSNLITSAGKEFRIWFADSLNLHRSRQSREPTAPWQAIRVKIPCRMEWIQLGDSTHKIFQKTRSSEARDNEQARKMDWLNQRASQSARPWSKAQNHAEDAVGRPGMMQQHEQSIIFSVGWTLSTKNLPRTPRSRALLASCLLKSARERTKEEENSRPEKCSEDHWGAMWGQVDKRIEEFRWKRSETPKGPIYWKEQTKYSTIE